MDVDEINVLAIDPQNHNLLYLGTGDGIFASRDSGKTLEKLHQTNRPVISLEIAVQQQLIIAATEDEVWKSSDAGNTWEEITGKLEDIHRVRPAGSNPTIVYASTFQGVFRSDDGGESWKDVSHDLPKNIQIVTVNPGEMTQQAPARGDVPMIIEKTQDRDTGPAPQQRPGQRPGQQAHARHNRQHQQKAQHDRHPTAPWGRHRVGTARIGNIHQAAGQGIAAQDPGQ